MLREKFIHVTALFKANGICIDIDCKSWIRCIQLSHFAVCYFLFFNILKISATFLVLETLFTNSHTDKRYVWGISKKLAIFRRWLYSHASYAVAFSDLANLTMLIAGTRGSWREILQGLILSFF